MQKITRHEDDRNRELDVTVACIMDKADRLAAQMELMTDTLYQMAAHIREVTDD